MATDQSNKKINWQARKRRVRAKVSGTADRPRLNVARSLKHLYVQLIDDQKGVTLLAAHDREIKGKGKTKVVIAQELGELIAKKASAQKITVVVFDRGGHLYHGRIKAVADGARKAGLKF
ncbi:50S ribosomal protein L18 [Patescibacteria group bacterium]|nr:50S ribosomal protein L18 [Patescibacteria group bacterium]